MSEPFPISKELKPNSSETREVFEQSFLNVKSIVSFVSDINGKRRDDVLNSLLLAQLAANRQYPNEDQSIEWYKEFVKVLNKRRLEHSSG